MPKIIYTYKKFNPEHQLIIDRANALIHQFKLEGYVFTLRQLYYQLIAKDLFPDTWISKEGTKNNVQNYKRLGDIVSAARRAGKIDWNAIEDRTRNLQSPSVWENPAEIISAVAQQFTVDLWEGQDYRPNVFVEKDALLGVVSQACSKYQVPYFSCRGYTSDSEIWVAAQRLAKYEMEDGQIPIILHLGDHDPSGKDMTRDIFDRIKLFSSNTAASEIEVKRLALNMDQVHQYNPPPNPAKATDARYKAYEEEFGDESWELDALSPSVMASLITDELDTLIDQEVWENAIIRRDLGRDQLSRVSDKWDEIIDGL